MKYVAIKIPALLFYLVVIPVVTALSIFVSLGGLIFVLDMYHSFSLLSRTEKSLSAIESNITVQPTQVSLSLKADSFVYDEQGGSVIGDSLMSFNAGSNDLTFGVSFPRDDGEQKSVRVSLSGKRDGANYLFAVKKSSWIRSVDFQVSGLDTSLNWYLDRKRVMPSSDGTLEVWLPKPDNVIYSSPNIVLVGYSGVDNSLQDGIILSYSDK